MKVQIVSDLHLEFSDILITNTNQADVLILGGDIMLAEKVLKPQSELGGRFRDFLQRVSLQFPHVIYIAGNHEFYGGYWLRSLDDLRVACGVHENIHFLERETKIIDDVLFVGATLWTDMNQHDPLTLLGVRDMMNDFQAITDDTLGYAKLKPVTTAERHRQTRQYLQQVLSANSQRKTVVVAHHCPSHLSCHDQYKDDHIMNGAFRSDCTDIMLDHPQIGLWTHGHTHHCFDYMVGGCRVVCNPRGYPSEHTNWNANCVVDL